MRFLARRAGALVATTLVALALGHVFLATTISGESLAEAWAGAPADHVVGVVPGDFGETPGAGCDQKYDYTPLCSSYAATSIAAMLRARVPIYDALIDAALVIGTLAGIAGGRWCAIRPRSRRTKVLHVLTGFTLSAPPFFLSLIVLFYFSSNVSEFVRLPFLSGSGDYAPLRENPVQYVKALWTPCLLAALPLAAYVLRITEATMTDNLQEDYLRTAWAKGLTERRVVNLHALPVAGPAIAAMTGVNVSTLLLNVAVIEYAFSIPGLFRIIQTAVRERDVPVLEAMVLEGVILIVLANFAADAIHARLDPRLRP